MRILVAVAWRNIWRNGRRSMITASAMAIAVGLCMAVIAIQDGMYLQMFDVLVGQTLGHVQVHHPDYPGKQNIHDTVPDSVLETVDATQAVHAATGRLFAYGLMGREGHDSAGVKLVGVDPQREDKVTRAGSRIIDGAWIDPENAAEVVIGVGLAKKLGAEVGHELVLMMQAVDGSPDGALLTVSGIVKTGSPAIDKAGAFIGLADMQRLFRLDGQLHQVILTTTDARLAPQVSAALGAQLGKDSVRTWDEADPTTAQLVAMQDVGSGILLFIVFTVAALGVLNTMLMSVFERTRELGVIRALGVSQTRVVLLVLFESIGIGLLATVGGLLLGGVLDAYLIVYGLDFSTGDGEGMSAMGVILDPVIHGHVRWQGIAMTLVSVFTVSIAAAIWPGVRAARLEPVEAMRHV